MSYTERFTERWELLGKISPASHTTEQNTGAMSFENIVRAVVIINCGVIGADLDIDIEEAVSSTGALQSFDGGGKDVVIPNADDNTVTCIEIKAEEFDVAGGYSYLNVEATPGAASIFSVEVWGEVAYPPASVTGLDSVVD